MRSLMSIVGAAFLMGIAACVLWAANPEADKKPAAAVAKAFLKANKLL